MEQNEKQNIPEENKVTETPAEELQPESMDESIDLESDIAKENVSGQEIETKEEFDVESEEESIDEPKEIDIEIDGDDSENSLGKDVEEDLKQEPGSPSEKLWADDEDDEEEEEESDIPEDYEPDATAESVIEAVLFASDEPMNLSKLLKVTDLSSNNQVRNCIKRLNQKYMETNSAFKIEKIAGGFQMMTYRIFNSWLLKLITVRTESKLTPAAMETLAIISYKQPIIRADIEAVRGVASGEMVRNLMQKGLVKVTGRAEVLGRPLLYGTTKKFLEVFGLNTIRDLPKVEELKKPR